MSFLWWKQSSSQILSKDQKKLLESELKSAIVTIQATIKYKELNPNGHRINLPQHWTKWDGNGPTQILYDECYLERTDREHVPKSVYKAVGKAFEDLSGLIPPMHFLFFVGEHGRKQLKETIRIVVLPAYQNQIITYKAVGYLESRKKEIFVLPAIFDSKSIVNAKFFLEMIEFAKDILHKHFPLN